MFVLREMGTKFMRSCHTVIFWLFSCTSLVVFFGGGSQTQPYFSWKNGVIILYITLLISHLNFNILHHVCCSAHGSHGKLTCAELDGTSNRHLLMRSVATLCAMAGFDSECLKTFSFQCSFLS